MRSRILHLADLHLGETHDYLGPSADARRAEADGVLRRITDLVLAPDSPVGGVVIAGDLFETHDPAPSLVEAVLADLTRLRAGNIRLLTVPGNHDEYSYPSSVYRRYGSRWPDRLVTNPAPEKVATWNLAGHECDLYAMAFIAGESRPPYDLIPVEPGAARKLVVLHGSLDANWTDRSLPLQSARLADSGLDYVALGHIHRPMEKRLGPGWVCYPGRIEGAGFADPGGADLVEIDLAAPDLTPLHRTFASRRIQEERWNLSGLDSSARLEEKLEAAADPGRIVRLRLAGVPGFGLEPDRLRQRWGSRFFHLDLRIEDEVLAAPALAELAAEHTVRGVFADIAARHLEQAADDRERRLYGAALRHGLAAFAAGTSQESP